MRALTYLRTKPQLDSSRPGLSRVPSAALTAVVFASVLLVAAPVSAGAAADGADEMVLASLALADATQQPQPKIAAEDAATAPLPSKVVLRTEIPKPAAVAKRSSSAGTRKSSRSGGTGGWQSARVSWYGPGFYGETMAGGGTLERDSMVVAHRSLPFGTRVMFSYKGKTVTAVVKDRGPYAGGRTFDLGPGTARALGFSGVGTVKYRILGR